MSVYSPSLLSPCSVRRFNPVLLSQRRVKRRCFTAVASKKGVFTSPEVAKSFDFAAEERIYKWWESQGYFKPTSERGSDPFVIPMPPPNVTGSLHMGHAMFVTLEDIMARYHRMQGRPTLWLPGTDHAGIATQLVVEKMLASEGIKRMDMSREDFTTRVWEWKEKYGSTITNQIKRLGASCDWSREHFTLDEQLSRKRSQFILAGAVIEAFVRLHEKGLIYQGSYMVNWSPNLQTAVSDLEVEYSEEPGFLYYIRYRVAGGSRSDFLTVATTRPETLFGDVAIAVNPMDERYSKYIGMNAIVPLTLGRHVPIIADKYVDKDFGTGVLKISPGHDHNDYLLARKIGLPILNVMNKDGTLNEVAVLYRGLDRFEARKKVWADLEETKLAVKKEPHTSRVPRSQRGGEIIEPLVSKQWFVTMEPLAEKALDAVKKGELTIIPERFEKSSVNQKCPHLVSKPSEMVDIYNHWLSNIKDWCISRQLWWGHRIPVWYVVGRDCEEDYIVAKDSNEALEKARKQYGKDVEIYQDPDVLDTWFSSALWPFSTLGWPDESDADFSQFYPTTVLETGHDILFFWVARMVMMGIEFTGKVPFKFVYLHGLIRDAQGRKMSKSLGNVIDPIDTIKEFGTDALRFSIALGTPGQDLNLSTERLAANKAFVNKLWNAGKFILQNLPGKDDSSAWDGIYSYRAVLLYVFENILKILHPFMPFVTEELWQALPSRTEALIVTSWPKTGLLKNVTSIKKFENLQALTRSIRNARAEYSVEPAKRISASIVASPDVVQYISKEKEVLSLLSRLELQNVIFTDSPPADSNQSVHIVVGEGLEAYLPLADMVDISAEVQRLSKRLSKMQTEYDGLVARLNSPNFKERAPEKIVREAKATMGQVFRKLFDSVFGNAEMRVVMLGLDAAGKTTILYKLQIGEVLSTVPTIGFNVEKVQYKNVMFTVWDVGGQEKLRPLWRHYFNNTDGLIYVVDSLDRERIDKAKAEFQTIINDPFMLNSVILVFANKQDMRGAMTPREVCEGLGLLELKNRKWHIQGTCALKGDGLYEGLDWLASTLKEMKNIGLSSFLNSF
ncbi:unnamed protein product [Rhodiola kirilowii]